MKKKTLILAIATAFVLSACANNGASNVQEETSNDTSTVPETNTATDSASVDMSNEASTTSEESSDTSGESSDTSADSPASEEDFKQAYKEIIEYEQERISAFSPDTSSEEYEDCIDCYWLYDIDKDNIPELLIRYGHYEASYHGSLYTYADGKAQLITDELPLGHTSFYADPGENGILSYWGHMGYASCSRLTLIDGKLESEELYSEDINEKLQTDENAWYKASNEIADGAYYLEEFEYYSTYPIEMYDVIADYSSGKKPDAPAGYAFPDNNPDFYTDIMQNDGIINAIALDHFMNTPGEIPFSKILEDGQVYEYAQGPLNAHGITYADLNTDGIYECIFYLGEGNEPEDNDYRVIMSLQDETVYAYLTFYPNETTVSEDGYFITEPAEYSHERYVKRVLFNRDECFTYAVPSEN